MSDISESAVPVVAAATKYRVEPNGVTVAAPLLLPLPLAPSLWSLAVSPVWEIKTEVIERKIKRPGGNGT